MREEVRSSSGAAADPPIAVARSSSPPHTPVASSAGASSPALQTNVASIDWLGGRQASRVDSSSQVAPHACQPSHSFDAVGTALDSAPTCRPWERGDLLRRLATFKPSTWASKPKAASSLACAQRGWVNIDHDKIECESCDAHLIFSALPSWSPVEVANAGEAFAEQLDAAHQNNCPWRGNSCADSLVQLHLTQSALIGGFKDRCDGLLQFTSLPVVASSAIENMRLTRGTQIDHLLSQSVTFLSGVLGCKAESTAGIDIHQYSSCGYSQAQKLISLCGWEPRWLPNVQDCEENSTHSAKNAPSVGPDEPFYPHFVDHRNSFSASAKKDKGKGKMPLNDSGCSMRSPLLDCSLCGATVRMLDFRSVLRPSRFSPNNIDAPETGRKPTLTRGISAASGINEWATDGVERGQAEGRDEAATNEGRFGVDLNLTMAGGLPSTQSDMPALSAQFNNGGMGRDLMIGQPTGSEVGDCETSYESRGPSSRKRNLEEGGSTADNPQDRLQHADSIGGNFIDRDGEEVDDAAQDSDIPNKKSRGFDLFDAYRSSSGAGPSRNLCFDLDADAAMFDHSRDLDLATVDRPAARESMRASSVIAMDTVRASEENSMDSVEYYPGNGNDIDMPSSSTHNNVEMNDVLDLNYSNQAQQSANAQPAAGSDARDIGGSSTNEGEEVINAETAPTFGRDQLSFGISGGSVGMGASHEAEIHGNAASLHRTESVVADAEPVAELTETMGQTGESAPGPGLMDEFVPEEVDREEPHGDSQDMMSRSVGQADSGSKIYGSTKADSVESGEKMGHDAGHGSSMRPSLSCNAGTCAGFDPSKDDVTQTGKILTSQDALKGLDYDPGNGLGVTNGENDYESGLPEFDPVKHHNSYCPWVNGTVAAACCNNTGSSSSTSALCGWQLTIDALDTFQSLGQAQNQMMQSDSAASLYMDDQITHNRKLGRRASEVEERTSRSAMPLCSFYASTSVPVAKPQQSSPSSKPTATAAVAAVATTIPARTATTTNVSTAAGALSLHLPELPSQVKDKILSLELMGVDYRRALSLNPALRDAAPESIHAVVTFLQSRGLHFKDLGRVFGMCPSVLTASVRAHLRPVFAFLSDDLGLPEPAHRRAIVKCPRLLACSVRDQLRPALLYLRRLGFRDTRALALQDPILLVSSVERTMAPKLEYLASGLGMSRDDAVAMVLRCPALLTFSIERNYKPKFEYLVEAMGGGVDDVKAFPQYFSFSLEKRIVPRHRAAVEAGVAMPLPDMLKVTDEEFREMLDKEQKLLEQQTAATDD
ncbi:hypothetical protein EJB05_04170 [Eragrostis curvula]|uniref:Uncharacterized protein n=1 Tax=Eragrostis curvula TaxID=38414 RepID=A0A5J9W8S7_9POAL|nr:hypothetical protein EJB05_04170 [Eragrostis curvula]